MNERWKYQIKTGGFWGIFMTVFTILFELKQVSFLEQISKPTFYIRLVVLVILGIFVLGYFNWKGKLKKEGK
jgi:glucan phosphoethanolaminetransferase (alkaline phosphatase superfamily)